MGRAPPSKKQVYKLALLERGQLVRIETTSTSLGVSEFTGLDYWTGLLEWTTGLTFHLINLVHYCHSNYWAVIIAGSYTSIYIFA